MRQLRPLLLVVPVVLLLLVATGSLARGAADELADVPAYVPVALPVVRVAKDILGALVLGGVVVAALLVSPAVRPLLKRVSWLAAAWAVATVVQAFLTLSEVLGLPLGQVLEPTVVSSFFSQTGLGRMFVAQTVAALLVCLLAPAILGRGTAWVVTVIAAAGLAAPALVGHGGLSGGHTAATISLAVHLLVIGLWLGGLAGVCQLAFMDSQAFGRVLPRFSALALVCVVLVAESGLLNASLRVGGPSSFLSSWYGLLVLAKSVLLLWLVLLGWRQRVTLAAGDDPRRSVVRLAAWEFGVMAVALGMSVVLARLGPPAAIPVTDHVLPASAALLTLALPALLQQVRAIRLRVYPEIAAVIAVVVCVLAVDVGVFAAVPGGSVVAALCLLASGWTFLASLPERRAGRLPGLLVFGVAWPLIVWFGPSGSAAGMVMSILIAEGILIWLHMRPDQAPAAVEQEAGDVAVV